MPSEKKSVRKALLIRSSTWEEVLGSYDAFDSIKKQFDIDEIELLAAEDVYALKFKHCDRRYADVITFPPGKRNAFLTFRGLLQRRKYSACVLVFHNARPQFNLKYIFGLLLCRGEKYIYLRRQGFVPLKSKQGITLLVEAVRWKLSAKAASFFKGKKLSGYSPFNLAPPDRILWIRPDYLGDVVMALPTLQALREKFPGVQIDVLVRRQSAVLLRGVPEIAQIHELDIFPYTHPALTEKERKKLFRQLAQRQYALAIDFRGDSNIWRLLRRLKIPVRLGRIDAMNNELSYMLTHFASSDDSKSHMVQQNIELLEQIGVSEPQTEYSLKVSTCQLQEVEDRLTKAGVNGPFVILHACSVNSIKEWLPERFAEVADYLIHKCGLNVVITGAGEDQKYNNFIIENMSGDGQVFNAAGWFELELLPALLKKAKFVVTIDSAPSHIAAAVGTTVIALMLPHLQFAYRPYGDEHRVLAPTESQVEVLLNNGFQNRLLEAISVEQVVCEIDALMQVAN